MLEGQNFQSLTSIVAIDLRGAIGCKNMLPWRLQNDMSFFRRMTTGSTVVMGRKTYDSIGKCLPRRNNVILSHNGVLFPETNDCKLALSIDETLFRVAQFADDDAFVIGGAITYGQFAPLVDRYLVTVVDHEVCEADAFLSDEIMADICAWKRTEIAKYPASEGVDDFAFSVFEVTAPDREARLEERTDRIRNYSSKLPKGHRKIRGLQSSKSGSQEAFAF